MKLSLLLLTFCLTFATISITNAQEAPPIFGDVTVKHPFSSDPLIVRGMSGGAVAGSKVAGRRKTATGACDGFVDETPDHTLTLTTKFDYLKLQAQSSQSSQDLTMIVKGPGGTWCNDDLNGKNPGMTGEWLPGNYQIWIGSYQKDQYFPYTLKITEVK